MSYAEAAYFDNVPVQHLADRAEHQRRERSARVGRDILQRQARAVR